MQWQENYTGKSGREKGDGEKILKGRDIYHGRGKVGGEGKIFLAGYVFWREKGMAPSTSTSRNPMVSLQELWQSISNLAFQECGRVIWLSRVQSVPERG